MKPLSRLLLTSLTKAFTACEQMLKEDSIAATQALVNQCIDILYMYRRACASSSAAGQVGAIGITVFCRHLRLVLQLVLPEALKTLPLYISALMKHPAFLVNPPGRTPAGPVRSMSRAFESM